jgi:hypothetical protein
MLMARCTHKPAKKVRGYTDTDTYPNTRRKIYREANKHREVTLLASFYFFKIWKAG